MPRQARGASVRDQPGRILTKYRYRFALVGSPMTDLNTHSSRGSSAKLASPGRKLAGHRVSGEARAPCSPVFVSRTSLKSAALKSADVRVALDRSEPLSNAPLRFAAVRLAPDRFASTTYAPSRLTRLRSVLDRFVEESSEPDRSAPLRSASRRSEA